ncbi:hypothetical protein V496_00340 [Pseudogymnoascus sp. VKM F-4515 (FW-2607)]|nr:hypothetical protein V496_00340 [Pseudogymnoascus sp. VKM F-4515 (FW-2607)]
MEEHNRHMYPYNDNSEPPCTAHKADCDAAEHGGVDCEGVGWGDAADAGDSVGDEDGYDVLGDGDEGDGGVCEAGGESV